MTTEKLKDEVKIFTDIYTEDVDSSELYSEMCHLKQVHQANIDAKGSVIKPLDLLNRLSKLKLSGLFPNICVALRIFLTLPVTVATAERSFSKLSFIKNKLRNSMSQGRLVSLSLLSIESELARKVDFNKIIDIFANAKARKVKF